jgi:hypothetical protein
MLVMGASVVQHLSRRKVPIEQFQVLLQLPLVAFDHHYVVSTPGNDLLAQGSVGIQSIAGDYGPLQRKSIQQPLRQDELTF